MCVPEFWHCRASPHFVVNNYKFAVIFFIIGNADCLQSVSVRQMLPFDGFKKILGVN